MSSEKITFKNEQGQSLAASLEKPVDSHPIAYAIFAHCFTCSKNLTAVANISRALMQEGIAVLRFDFTGLGESEGDFSDTNFSSNVYDLVAAANFLEKNYDYPQLLIGHSLGGAAVLAASLHLEKVNAVATIGAPASPRHVRHLFDKDIDAILEDGEAQVSIGGRPFKIKSQFIEDLNKHQLKDELVRLKKALLIMHSPQDQIVGIENAAEIYENTMHPKSFLSLDGADHLLNDKNDSLYAGDMIAAWCRRYISIKSGGKSTLISEKQVVTRTKENYTTEINAGGHSFVADEPESVGGSNLGPDPYALLLSSLGACTGMTLRMYANRKNWPLKEVKVHLAHSKAYDTDCKNCDGKDKKIDYIERQLEMEGDLSETQRKRLHEIADKCPVHKTLLSKTNISTTLI